MGENVIRDTSGDEVLRGMLWRVKATKEGTRHSSVNEAALCTWSAFKP